MITFLALFLVCLVASISIACAINYFLDCGPWRALGFGLFGVAVFLFFAASGLWVDASRHDWGKLTPLFALMLAGGWLCLKYGKKAWVWWDKKKKEKK